MGFQTGTAQSAGGSRNVLRGFRSECRLGQCVHEIADQPLPIEHNLAFGAVNSLLNADQLRHAQVCYLQRMTIFAANPTPPPSGSSFHQVSAQHVFIPAQAIAGHPFRQGMNATARHPNDGNGYFTGAEVAGIGRPIQAFPGDFPA